MQSSTFSRAGLLAAARMCAGGVLAGQNRRRPGGWGGWPPHLTWTESRDMVQNASCDADSHLMTWSCGSALGVWCCMQMPRLGRNNGAWSLLCGRGPHVAKRGSGESPLEWDVSAVSTTSVVGQQPGQKREAACRKRSINGRHLDALLFSLTIQQHRSAAYVVDHCLAASATYHGLVAQGPPPYAAASPHAA